MQRILQPELLDSLPPDHPDALHNRRDLHLTNRVVGNHRWFLRSLPPLLRRGETALEIGSGTGELGVQLAARGVPVAGLDLWPRPPNWPVGHRWIVADIKSFDDYDGYAAVLGNLIFHQFSADELEELGAKLRPRVRIIAASETARSRTAQWLFRAFGRLARLNHVTLHDAHVSIAAGFRGDELARALGLRDDEWRIHCRTTPLGVYRLLAIRRA